MEKSFAIVRFCVINGQGYHAFSADGIDWNAMLVSYIHWPGPIPRCLVSV